MNVAYAIALLVSSLVSATVGLVALRRRPAPAASSLAILSASLVAWSLPYAISWAVNTPEQQRLWLMLSYVGVVAAPPALFVLVAKYTRRDGLLTTPVRALLIAEPVATLAVLWTDPLHGWFFGGIPATTMILNGGPWFWFNVAFDFGLIIVSAVMLALELGSATSRRRKQTVVLLLAVSVPVASALVGVLGMSPLPELDLTPFAFTASGALFGYGLFQLGLLELLPIAREQLIESMRDGVIVFDPDALIAYLNPAARAMLDLTPEAIGRRADDVLPRWSAEIAAIRAGTQSFVVRLPGPGPRYVETSVERIAEEGDVTRIATLVTLRDVTERQLAQIALEDSEYQYRLLSETMRDVIWTLDVETMRFTYVSPSVESLRGYTPAEAMAQPVAESLTAQSAARIGAVVPERLSDFIASGASRGHSFTDELEQPCKDGTTVWTEVVSCFVRDERTGRILVVAVTRDITERKRLREELARQATTDSLTGVANRRHFEELAEAEIKRSLRYGHEFTIVVVDVDDLKRINDTLGHLAGDQAIIRVANALKAAVRDTDVVARYGGDEFAVLAPETGAGGALAMMQRAQELLREHAAGPDAPGLSLSFSFGSGMCDAEHCTLDAMVAQADARLYQQKHAKKAEI